MNESDYHRFADMALNSLYDILEQADEEGLLDIEYQDGVMTIRLPSGKHYIINKHAISREIWLSSPVSGGLHFKYFSPIRGEARWGAQYGKAEQVGPHPGPPPNGEGEWTLPDGRTLGGVLAEELQTAGIEVKF